LEVGILSSMLLLLLYYFFSFPFALADQLRVGAQSE